MDEEEVDVEEIDDTSQLEGDEVDTRQSVILEDDENGQIIRVGKSAQEGYAGDDDTDAEEEESAEVDLQPAGDSPPAETAATGTPPAREAVQESREPEVQANTETKQAYNGFSLTPDGLGLYERAYEDANSVDAEALIYGTVDEDGNEVTKGIGEREYARRCGAYEASKFHYAQSKTQEVDTIISIGLSSMRQEVESLNTELAKRLKVPVEAIEGFEPYRDRAFELIDEDRQKRALQYIGAGYSDETAFKLANRDVLGHPGVVTLAFKAAAMEKEGEYLEVVHAVKLKAAGIKPAEAPTKAADALPVPPPTTTNSGVPATAVAAKTDFRKYPKALLQMAKQTGIHPDKLALN